MCKRMVYNKTGCLQRSSLFLFMYEVIFSACNREIRKL